ncbi:helix-turn-helix domain-containing protein [Propionibacteriaceae bacterium Y2011]
MGNVVLELRESAGISQAELARRSGVAQPNIAAYEVGRRKASPAMVQRLQRAARPLPREALATHHHELVTLAADHGLTNLRVFGSVVRGTDGPGSDLDLLVSRSPGVGLMTLAAFAERATNLLGVDVDVVTDGGLPADHELLTTAVAI